MASRIRKPVQRVTGWLFVIVVMVALAAALHYAMKPHVEVTGPVEIQRMH
jgi:hypothetical protein